MNPESTGPGLDSPLRRMMSQRVVQAPTSEAARGRFRDGAEARVLELIQESKDLNALSDELEQKAVTWPERYHLSPDRANILRGLRLAQSDRILEIGSGCGAITRYLGETCDLVDAVEPDADRARVGRARVRDLPNVMVHVADLDEIPDRSFYDVAIVTGVLEYVGL